MTNEAIAEPVSTDRTGWWLRAEGAAVLTAALVAYGAMGTSWLVFALLILVPDIFMAGYLRGPRLGALIYNFGHTYATPILLVGLSIWFDQRQVLPYLTIWIAHIGMDRLFGYGLKRDTGFKSTHLG